MNLALDRDVVNVVVTMLAIDRSNMDFGCMLKDQIWEVRLVSKVWYCAFERLYGGIRMVVGGRNIYIDLEIANVRMNLFDWSRVRHIRFRGVKVVIRDDCNFPFVTHYIPRYIIRHYPDPPKTPTS